MQKLFGKIVLLFILIASPDALAEEVTVRQFGFEPEQLSPCDRDHQCYRIQDLVRQTWQNAFDTNIERLTLTQARKHQKSKLGALLPHVNIGAYINWHTLGPSDFLDRFFGFVFPNRWLDLVESKHQKDAEKELVKTVFADRTNTTLSIYYSLQSQILGVRICLFYRKLARDILQALQHQKAQGLRDVSEEDIGLLRAVHGRIVAQEELIDNLTATYPLLAQSVGFNFEEDWQHYRVEESPYLYFGDLRTLELKDFLERALQLSPELRALHYQKKAIKAHLGSMPTQFLDPSGNPDLDLGYGLFKQMEISKVQLQILGYQKRQVQGEVYNRIALYENNYNDALVEIRGLKEAQEGLRPTFEAAQKNINNPAEPLNMVRVLRLFELGFDTDLTIVTCFFSYLTAAAGLQRSTWDGPFYPDLLRHLEAEVLPHHNQVIEKLKKFFAPPKGSL